jgi:Xaa-Pro dipeptidase
MSQAANAALGTSVALEGDFACGMRGVTLGGAPLSRRLQAGELYILDVFPPVYGYRADLCRTAAVGVPSPAQESLRAAVAEALQAAAAAVRPGVACAAVQAQLTQQLDRHPRAGGSFRHHGGHGIGLDPHESPRITLESQDLFEVGDVFTLEPGLYAPSLGGGVRLEDNYRVTQSGVERLNQDDWNWI